MASRKNMTTKHLCSDGDTEINLEPSRPRRVTKELVFGGDWGDLTKTVWVDVWVTPLAADGEPIEDKRACITIAIDPEEPPCVDGQKHEWCSPHEVVGGRKENPGVWGHSGGVIITEVCSRCGRYRKTETWAQNPTNGVEGLESVEYRDPDKASLAWVRSSED